jgi:hypothetical protein
MQQVRSAAESAVIRPKQAIKRKPAPNGAGFREITPERRPAGRRIGSARLKIAFPAPFKAVLEPAQNIKARIT